MGYLGRRIGLSQDQGDSNPGAANGAVGGGILDLFANGYFERQGNLYNAPGAPPPEGMIATGGIISDYVSGSDVYRTHIFTSTGAFDVTAIGNLPAQVDYLVIGGGGGGGGENMGTVTGTGRGGGGGGAGGYRTSMPEGPGGPSASAEGKLTAAVASYTITVGAGGLGGTPSPGNITPGSFSNFAHPSPIRSEGGGAGRMQPHDGHSGGSGGGGAGATSGGPYAGGLGNRVANDPTTPAPNQGYAGGGGYGFSPDNSGSGGGGGGAGGAAADGGSGGPAVGRGGYGGAGKTSTITGTSTARAGGGAAGNTPGGNHDPQGGAAGGGSGGNGGSPTPQDQRDGDDGTSGTGSGGGGGGGTSPYAPNAVNGGNGAGGFVAIRYQIAQLGGQQKATGGAISFYGDKTIHTFTSSQNFTTTSDWVDGNVEYVVVGGGGAGGDSIGGGGGAGGFITGSTPVTGTGTAIAVTVGGGGGQNTNSRGGVGTPSTFGSPLTAWGGGGGGSDNSGLQGATNGGSGGGASVQSTAPYIGAGDRQTDTSTPAPISPQGYSGGGGSTDAAYIGLAGGGGGAGGVGESAPTSNWAPGTRSGHGGIGKQAPATFHNPVAAPTAVTGGGLGAPGPTGTNVSGGTPGKFWFAGGGGGGGDQRPAGNSNNPPHAGGTGGSGPGGGGPYAGGGNGENTNEGGGRGIVNTGGGGGGGQAAPASGTIAGRGASGLVLIAYPS